MESESREMSSELFNKSIDDLIQRIFTIVNSNDVNEKLGGIMAIDELLDIQCEENETKIIRFANALRMVFQHGVPSSDTDILESASKALGHLARVGGTLTADFVEFEVKRALEWLQADRDRFEQRRYAAVLVLKELAENAPTLFNVHISTFLEYIWAALRDPSQVIREGAVSALRSCLKLIGQRDRWRIQWYFQIFTEAQKGFKHTTVEGLHGSMLVMGELLRNSGSDFMQARFKDVCDTILRYRNSKDKLIFTTVISLMPQLAAFLPEAFVRGYLPLILKHLISALQQGQSLEATFLAIGEVAIAVKDNIKVELETIFSLITEHLNPKSKRGFYTAALTCISMLSSAVGPGLIEYLTDSLFDMMFNDGLGPALIASLLKLVRNIPQLLPSVQERLVSAISVILRPSSDPTDHAGKAQRSSIYTKPQLVGHLEISSGVHSDRSADDGLITLALKTLSEFDFNNKNLLLFVRNVVLTYIDDDNHDIRLQAALTCAKLLIPTLSPSQKAQARGTSFSAGRRKPFVMNTAHMRIVSDVLERLLTAGIADSDPVIRRTILASLDERFDQFLAQAENLHSLFIALNDEIFSIREEAIAIIGRLALRNPAYVLPSLRKTLIQLLTELQFSSDTLTREESCKLLGHLTRASHRLIKPYIASVLDVLMPKLSDPDHGVASQVLATIGQLSSVGGEDMIQNITKLLPIINQVLHDKSSTVKREVALKTLGQLVLHTGYVIKPFISFPELLAAVLDSLKADQPWSIRREASKVIGIIGALDPFKHKMIQQASEKLTATKTDSKKDASASADIVPSSEDYYPTVAIRALMKILCEPSLSSHHMTVVFAIMYILRSFGLNSVPFLPQIIPHFLTVMRSCDDLLREQLFQQLKNLVQIVKQHIRHYLDDIFKLVHEYWYNENLLPSILVLVEEISLALKDESKVFLADLIPQMLNILHSDRSETRQPTVRVLHTLETFGLNLEDYLYLIIPPLMRMSEHCDTPIRVRQLSLQVVSHFSRTLNFSDFASRIMHPLARILDNEPKELHSYAINVLCSLIYQLGQEFTIFIPTIEKILAKGTQRYETYSSLVQKLLNREQISLRDLPNIESKAEVSTDAFGAFPDLAGGPFNKIKLHHHNLKKAWEASQRSTLEDWLEWMRRFSVELLNQNPSPALRSCSALAARYYPLARELFNAAFVSCWTELYDQYQDDLVKSLETAFQAPNIPPEILQTLLNLAEFMEHDDKALPIDIGTLGSLAEKCHAYAKALHYKELEFHTSPSASNIEALISINNQLQQPEAAVGILEFAQKNHSIELRETWYEKLQRWEDALEAYERKQLEDPSSIDLTLGRMRCLRAMGEWERLDTLSHDLWLRCEDEPTTRSVIAPLAASAAWNMGSWEQFSTYVQAMDESYADGTFFRAILAVKHEDFDAAQLHIDKTRQLLDNDLTALVGESYNRAYRVIISIQQLAELEEVITYKCTDDPSQKALIRSMWTERLNGMQRIVEVWQQILSVRSLVLSPHEDLLTWLKFSSLCRKSGHLALSLKVLNNLMGSDVNREFPVDTPKVSFAYTKHLWAAGSHEVAFGKLNELSNSIVNSDDTRLRARCYLKLGTWQQELTESLDDNIIVQVLNRYQLATSCDPESYKAWHAWALMNYQAVSFFENKNKPDAFSVHLKPAVTGFFRSISLASRDRSLQDVLRLLTLWFKHGAREDVEGALLDGFNTISIDTWLDVIPQIIARVHSPQQVVRRQIHDLLARIGQAHPQSLIYPLTVASKSSSIARKTAAENILDHMRQHSPVLVEQAQLVSREIIRVAILWTEMWHEALEEASRLYFGQMNIEAMFVVLDPLHDIMERGAETTLETGFLQSYGRDLQNAHEFVVKYRKTKLESDLNHGWEMYYQVFKSINKQLPQLLELDLQSVSPNLFTAKDLELAIPGTYSASLPVVSISNFASKLKVIESKQRPRKITIKGSDGKDYDFLLKGHEDLRQDERVMQLFGLVNTLLANDSQTSKYDLAITRCAVIPLSPNSGLMEWLPHTDTLHYLIKEYRDARKILLNIEHRLMLQMAQDYQLLTVIQRIEVFEYALANTTGQDLYKVLWLKSDNSEQWLERRTSYTRSLAVMSMVGYILGLGDRHPCNLMLDRKTGKIVHIDFGDCFIAGTPISLACGMSKSIEDFDVSGGSMVYSAEHDGSQGIVLAQQSRMLKRGKRDVLELTLTDGRQLVCTPEHRFLTRDGWVEAQNLKLDSSKLVVGPECPLDVPQSNEEEFTMNLGSFNFSMKNSAERDRMLAFARIIGFATSDGSIPVGSRSSAKIYLGHTIDYNAFIADCDIVNPGGSHHGSFTGRVFVIQLPVVFKEAFIAAGMVIGKKFEEISSLPAVFLDDKCPISVVREFLAGMFGGDGWAPQLVNQDSGYRLRSVKFMHHIQNIHVQSLTNSMNQIRLLLARCGVDGVRVEAPIKAKRSDKGYSSKESTMKIRLTIPGNTQFGEKVGFRFCSHKQIRLAAALAYWRYKETLLNQRELIIQNAVIYYQNHHQSTFKVSIEKSIHHLQQEGVALLSDSIPQPCAVSRRIKFPLKKSASNKLGMNAHAFFQSIGCLEFFQGYSVPSEAKSLPSFELCVVSRRMLPDQRDTFDISVPNAVSFLASGVVVHNCFEVAMKREKFPEKIPFRLTRMMVNAMEVSGIEGSFRSTCNVVMRVLRENRESVMAVLEAFVYDPLINWRLLKGGDAPKHNTTNSPPTAVDISDFNAQNATTTAPKILEEEVAPADVINKTALDVLERIQHKLTGRDFDFKEVLTVEHQVKRLIAAATSHENLAQCYIGWCPFW